MVGLGLVPGVVFSVVNVVFNAPTKLKLACVVVTDTNSRFSVVAGLDFPSFLVSTLVALNISMVAKLVFANEIGGLSVMDSLGNIRWVGVRGGGSRTRTSRFCFM